MTVIYKEEKGAMIPLRVHTVVISVQHDDVISLEEQRKILKEKVIKAVVPAKYLDDKTIYHLQPSGRFVIGGPQVSFFMTHSCFFISCLHSHKCINGSGLTANLVESQGDAGLTGRKIIVDTYGGWGAHGGGAFSGKDCTKVDRSGAYAARWVAKSLVKAKLCKRVLVQVR